MRLQVVLSRAGITSRRKAVEIIENGHVLVNGKIVREKGYAVDPDKDNVEVSGKRLTFKKKVYIILNKPKGFITSKHDPEGRKTVFDMLPKEFRELHPVGRLDMDTTGLLILTNDGDLTYRLTHPKFEVRKKYRVYCRGKIGDREIRRLERGIIIEGRKTARAKVSIISADEKVSDLYIEVHEGRKRQIRSMFLFLGHPIKKLERIGYEFLKLGSLRKGAYRRLRETEIKKLKEL
ncbi:MAG: rRNA pseudouridine synthase [Candidatus Omnitrophica bacterium]|nr:rRNA pseudouridine synthase [Candidatus Omnitrophota bacterium]